MKRSRFLPVTETGLGFLVAAGAGASVSRDFQRSRRTRSELLSYITTRVLDAARGEDSVSLLDGYHGALAFDGSVAQAQRWIAVFITSLPQFGGQAPRTVQEGSRLHSLAFRFDKGAQAAPR